MAHHQHAHAASLGDVDDLGLHRHLQGVGPKKTVQWMETGVHTMSAIPASAKLNPKQHRQLRAQREGRMLVERGLLEALRPAIESTRLGFLDFVRLRQQAEAEPDALLFEGEKAFARDQWGRSLGDWFAKHVRGLGLPGRKLTFHSLRHDFRDALREAEVEPELADYLMGHARAGMGAVYGGRPSLQRLQRRLLWRLQWLRRLCRRRQGCASPRAEIAGGPQWRVTLKDRPNRAGLCFCAVMEA